MGCCVSGSNKAKVEPWPSYHDTFEAKGSTSSAHQKHVSQKVPSEIKQSGKPNPNEDEHRETRSNVSPESPTFRRTASTQTKESSFDRTSKADSKEQGETTKSGINRFIQVTEADITFTQNNTYLDKEKETWEVSASFPKTHQTNTASGSNIEEPIVEEAVKGLSTNETDDVLEIEDIEEKVESQVKYLLPSDIKRVTFEATNQICDGEVDRNTDEEVKDGIHVESNGAEGHGDTREPEEAKDNQSKLSATRESDIDHEEINLMKANIISSTADTTQGDGNLPPSSASVQIRAEEPVGGFHEQYSECLALLPPSGVITETTDPAGVGGEKEVGEDVHEACSVCLVTGPPRTISAEVHDTEITKEEASAKHPPVDEAADTAGKVTLEREVEEGVQEAGNVCLATTPPPATTRELNIAEEITEEKNVIEAPSPSVEESGSLEKTTEEKGVGEEVHETCSVCLATAPPATMTAMAEENNVEKRADLKETDTTEKVTMQKEAGEVHEVCSVCLANAPTSTFTTEIGKAVETEGSEPPSSIIAADTVGLDIDESATAPLEGSNIEDNETSTIATEEGTTDASGPLASAAGEITAEANRPPIIATEDHAEASRSPSVIREGTDEPSESPAVAIEGSAEVTESRAVPTEGNSSTTGTEDTAESTKSPAAVATGDTTEATHYPTTAIEESTVEGHAEQTEPPMITTEEHAASTDSPTIATEDGPAKASESPAVPREDTAGSTQSQNVGREGTVEALESPIITTVNGPEDASESPSVASEGTAEVTKSDETKENTPRVTESLNNEAEVIDNSEESQTGATAEGTVEATQSPAVAKEDGSAEPKKSPTTAAERDIAEKTESPPIATEDTAEAAELSTVPSEKSTAEATESPSVTTKQGTAKIVEPHSTVKGGCADATESPNVETQEGTPEATISPTVATEANEHAIVPSEECSAVMTESPSPTEGGTSETELANAHTQDKTEATVSSEKDDAADEATNVQAIQKTE